MVFLLNLLSINDIVLTGHEHVPVALSLALFIKH